MMAKSGKGFNAEFVSDEAEEAAEKIAEKMEEQKKELLAMGELLSDEKSMEADEAALEYASNVGVPQSEVPIPSSESINDSAQAAIFQNNEKGVGRSAATTMKHYDAGTYKNFVDAINHRDDKPTGTAVTAVGKEVVPVPPSTRDLAAGLYQHRDKRTGRITYVRDRADKLLHAAFGPMAWRVFNGAARQGFDRKPLVWVSQQTWHQLVALGAVKNGEITKWSEETGDAMHEFNPAVDEDPRSPVLRVFAHFLNEMTIREITRLARYEQVSALAVLRFAMWRYCTQIGVPKKPPAAPKKDVEDDE